jgi:group I intron endonuclease
LSKIKVGSGVYCIYCTETGYYYYGESKNLPQRIGMHIDELNSNKHISKKMQEDWNKYGMDSFEFYVVDSGKQYEDIKVRRAQELFYINQQPDKCYNIAGSSSRIIVGGASVSIRGAKGINFPIIINGVTYSSLRAIERAYALSRATIRKRLLKLNKRTEGTNIIWEEKAKPTVDAGKNKQKSIKSKPYNAKISIYGKIYDSVLEAAKQTGKSRSTIYRLLQHKEESDCFYLNPDGSSISKDFYTTHTRKPTHTFTIDGVFYSSVQDVCEKFNICKSTVYRRCKNPSLQFKNWQINE